MGTQTATPAGPTLVYEALDPGLGARLLAAGSDDSGSAVVATVDPEGGRPLRCCLRDSRPGERTVLVSVAPAGPVGPYRETGPVFLHAEVCTGCTGVPEFWETRRQVLRAYDDEGRINGGAIAEVGEQEHKARELLADPDVAFVQSRNVVYGCYMLTVRRLDRA